LGPLRRRGVFGGALGRSDFATRHLGLSSDKDSVDRRPSTVDAPPQRKTHSGALGARTHCGGGGTHGDDGREAGLGRRGVQGVRVRGLGIAEGFAEMRGG